LAGLLLAEVASELRPREQVAASRSWRTAAYVTSALANNLPDFDFLYTGITGGSLGYLLHHRGHSHTVLVACALGLLTIGTLAAVARRRKRAWSTSDLRWLFGLSMAGPLVHIAMDFTNNYGVHPFWPLYDGWMYGDAIFIVEPLFWAVGLPPLIFAAEARTTRFVYAFFLATGVGLCWLVSMSAAGSRLVLPMMALVVTIAAAAVTVIAWRVGSRARIAIGVLGSWAIVAVFLLASSAAKRAVLRSPLLAGAIVREVVVTPMPADPLCFTALVIQTRRNDYIVSRATVATAPTLLSVEHCAVDSADETTAPLVGPWGNESAAIRWRGEFTAPLEELVALARDNCQAAALLRFLRVPYWLKTGAESYLMGDLRYDRTPALDFSDVDVAASPATCPRAVPGWLSPRRDLLLPR